MDPDQDPERRLTTHTLTMQLERSQDGSRFVLTSDQGQTSSLDWAVPALDRVAARLRRMWSDTTSRPLELPQLLRQQVQDIVLPAALFRLIAVLAPAPSDGGASWLVVAGQDPTLTLLPWEQLLPVYGLCHLRVLRTPGLPATLSGTPPTRLSQGRPALLVSCHNLLSVPDPDAAREIEAVPRLLASQQRQISTLQGPSLEGLAIAMRRLAPEVVHLITYEQRTPEGLRLLIGDGRGGSRYCTVAELAAALHSDQAPTLIVLNFCDSGTDLGAELIASTSCAWVVGWYANVNSGAASDFASLLYTHLAEGRDVPSAVAAQASRAGDRIALCPALWTRDPAALTTATQASASAYSFSTDTAEAGILSFSGEPRLRGAEPAMRGAEPAVRGGEAAFRGAEPAMRGAEPATRSGEQEDRLDITLSPASAICPAMLLNGQAPIERVCLTSSRRRSVRVSIQCDTGNGASTWSESRLLERGDNPLPPEQIHFPALFELMARGIDRRQINITVTVTHQEQVIAEKTQSALYLGPTEWLNLREAWRFIPSYVLTESEAVKRCIGLARDWTDGKAEAAVRDDDTPDDIDRKMQAVYQALCGLNLDYITPPGAPVTLSWLQDDDDSAADSPVSVVATGQRVRFPNEVVNHKRGTCHDLALLFAACAEHWGVYPLVVLIPGHTLFGYWRRIEAHSAYWRRRESSRAAAGGAWLLTDRAELMTLVTDEDVRLVEATAITRREPAPVSFEQACKDGLAPFNRRFRTLDCAVDIWASRPHVEPLYRSWASETPLRDG